MPSVESTGDSYDNALAETINGLYKTELIYKRGPWKTRESLELATLQWVHWFNHGRLLESIGHIPPAEAEANYWRQAANTVQADCLHFNKLASTKPGVIQPVAHQSDAAHAINRGSSITVLTRHVPSKCS